MLIETNVLPLSQTARLVSEGHKKQLDNSHFSWDFVALHNNFGRFVHNDGNSKLDASNGAVGQASRTLRAEPEASPASGDTCVHYVTTTSILNHHTWNNLTNEQLLAHEPRSATPNTIPDIYVKINKCIIY